MFNEMQLCAPILKALQVLGYKEPTPIQAQAIPLILKGGDVMASAQTGTGKTAAFVLPALQKISLEKSSNPRVLILTPTRELATQVTTATAKYGKFVKFYQANLVGGMSYKQQIRELSRPLDLIVATPGRLLDHIRNERVDLSHVEMFVLDEADRMLDMGFIDDVKEIAKYLPKKRQTLLFSATLDDRLLQAIRHMLKDPARIDFSDEMLAPALIKQEYYFADDISHKQRLLEHFLANENLYKAIIFSATKVNADKIAKHLRDLGYAALALHGDLKQNVRNKTVQRLRAGKTQFLVATDVAARGIDINDLTHVINYDLPRFAEDYVHRIGRTGRAGKEGKAISFVLPSDVVHLRRIEKFIGEKIASQEIEGLEARKKFSERGAPSRGEKRGGGGKSKSSFGKKKKYGSSNSSDKKPYVKRFEKSGGEERSFKKRFEKDSSEKSGREEKPYRKSFDRNSESQPQAKRFERDGEKRPYAKRFEKDGDKKPFGKKFERDSERKPYAKRFEKDGEKKPFAKRFDRDSERKPYAKRFEKDGEKKPFAKRFEKDSERKPYAKRFEKDGDKKPYAKRFEKDGEKKPFAKRFERDSEKKPYAKRFEKDGDKKPYAKRFEKDGEKKPFGKRSSFAKPDAEGTDRKKRSFDNSKSFKKPGKPFKSGAKKSRDY